MDIDPMVLIVTLTAMVMAIHLNTSWRLKGLNKRLKAVEKEIDEAEEYGEKCDD